MKKQGNSTSDPLTYPVGGTLDRWIYKIPLFAWRLGYGPFPLPSDLAWVHISVLAVIIAAVWLFTR